MATQVRQTKKRRSKTNASVSSPVARAASLAYVRQQLGVTRSKFSRITGLSERTLASVESGNEIGEAGLRRLREIDRLRERLGRVMKPEFIPQWLESPNETFNGLKPIEVLERGEIDRIWSLLFQLESGNPS
jgi:transcriptional regulator with XRE-family HTH domain